MKFLIKLATRGRLHNFYRTILNIKSTIGDSFGYEIIVSCDEDDLEMNNDEVKGFVEMQQYVKIFYAPQTDKIGAINRDIEKAKQWDVLINFSDDMLWVVKNWGCEIEKDIKECFDGSLDCFLHYNDNFVGDKLPTLNICGKEYYDRFGYIYHPSYHAFSSDAENFFISKMLGKHRYFPKVLFHHVHPSNLRFESDATYRLNDKWGAIDTENYFQRREKLFFVENPVCIPYNPLIRE